MFAPFPNANTMGVEVANPSRAEKMEIKTWYKILQPHGLEFLLRDENAHLLQALADAGQQIDLKNFVPALKGLDVDGITAALQRWLNRRNIHNVDYRTHDTVTTVASDTTVETIGADTMVAFIHSLKVKAGEMAAKHPKDENYINAYIGGMVGHLEAVSTKSQEKNSLTLERRESVSRRIRHLERQLLTDEDGPSRGKTVKRRGYYTAK